jgi:hypothetical protein
MKKTDTKLSIGPVKFKEAVPDLLKINPEAKPQP